MHLEKLTRYLSNKGYYITEYLILPDEFSNMLLTVGLDIVKEKEIMTKLSISFKIAKTKYANEDYIIERLDNLLK